MNHFIATSLDLNLFFLRIMKEHSFFLEIAFTPKDQQLAQRSREFKNEFEKLLSTAVALADGNVSREAIESSQIVTRFTADAERLTHFYTGSPFNIELTRRESMLKPGDREKTGLEQAVESLNRKAYRLTAALADFKDRLLQNVLSCRIFTLNYPLLIEHILREARMFMRLLSILIERRSLLLSDDLINQEVFWNRQMAEHAKFIAGLLDPSEDALIDTARMFGREFDNLTSEARKAVKQSLNITETTEESIAAVKRLRTFKAAGTEGLLECNIKSIIVPLLADHVLREANHYLCILGVCS